MHSASKNRKKKKGVTCFTRLLQGTEDSEEQWSGEKTEERKASIENSGICRI